MKAVLLISCSGVSSDNRENELLRKETELAKKEAELAKKELELSKETNNSNSSNVVVSETPDNHKPATSQRTKTPRGLNTFAENNDEEVLAVDLNGDGQDEYIGIIGMCGSGGCQVGVFQRTANGFRDIFDGEELLLPDPAPPNVSYWKPDYRFLAGPQTHNGYLDISIVWKKGKPDKFRFDGVKYRIAK